MEVKKGDTIGFHCEGMSMIAYDEFTDFNAETHICEPRGLPEVGTSYLMNTYRSTGNMQYSLSAVVRPGMLSIGQNRFQNKRMTNG